MISYRGMALFFLLCGSSAYLCALWLFRQKKYAQKRKEKQYSKKQSDEKTTMLGQQWEDQICEYTRIIEGDIQD